MAIFSVINIGLSLGKIFSPTVSACGCIGSGADPKTAKDLVVPWRKPHQDLGLPALLCWHCRLSDFSFPQAEMDKLQRWADADIPISVKFICGEGGVGKSRLAAEFASRTCDNGWTAGFVSLHKGQSFPTRNAGTLLIVDYPEEHRKAVLELLQDLTTLDNEHRLRVRFLTRRQAL